MTGINIPQYLLDSYLQFNEKRYGGWTIGKKNRPQETRQDYGIRTWSHPLRLSVEQLGRETLLQRLGEVGIAFVFLIGLSLVPCTFAVYVVGKRIGTEATPDGDWGPGPLALLDGGLPVGPHHRLGHQRHIGGHSQRFRLTCFLPKRELQSSLHSHFPLRVGHNSTNLFVQSFLPRRKLGLHGHLHEPSVRWARHYDVTRQPQDDQCVQRCCIYFDKFADVFLGVPSIQPGRRSDRPERESNKNRNIRTIRSRCVHFPFQLELPRSQFRRPLHARGRLFSSHSPLEVIPLRHWCQSGLKENKRSNPKSKVRGHRPIRKNIQRFPQNSSSDNFKKTAKRHPIDLCHTDN
ncbi:ATP-binding cassette sub-family A member 1 [Caerostris extrusa]|uniref:ATP-binding cassette sub-family A member 1 n=1 Tax=Caerostris extrusa TaxID=172846 RepID=A0AAV4TZG5_CAEEX|nr:ATP-binding cassette sub-family A member 1 [Caerostris extrusa]